MRGHAVYFFMLKDDLIESFKRVEEKLGGLQYVVHTTYKEPKFEIFDSIEKITDIGLIKPIRPNYFIALKNEKFTVEVFEKSMVITIIMLKINKDFYNFFLLEYLKIQIV